MERGNNQSSCKILFFCQGGQKSSIDIYIYRGLHTRRINRDSVSIDLLSRTPVRQRSSNREGIFRKNLSCPLNGESESRFDARITAEASNAPPQPNRRENATRPSYWPCVTALHTGKGSNEFSFSLFLSLFSFEWTKAPIWRSVSRDRGSERSVQF